MIIRTRVPNYNGVRAGVTFVNGVGETDSPYLIEWFKSNGYFVDSEKCEEVQEPVEKTVNLNDMTVDEIREWAKANGHGSVIRNYKSKEKLIELLGV